MLRKAYHDLRAQRMSSADRQQLAEHSGQAQSCGGGKQRRAKRYGADHRSVGINTPAELKRQQHGGAARQRCGKQKKRKRLPCAGPPEQQHRRNQKTREFQQRLPQSRHAKQGDPCVYRSEQGNGDRREQSDPHAHPCRREQINTAVHQHIVHQERFDRDLHATRITITVMSSDPPRVCASSRSASPVVPPACSAARIVFSIPSVSTSCTPSEQSTIRSFR